MPYLQLEVNQFYPTETKKRLAKAVGAAYAEIMETSAETLASVV